MSLLPRCTQIENPTARLTLTNESAGWVAFTIAAPATSGAAREGALPEWLDVVPASGHLAPQACDFLKHPVPLLLLSVLWRRAAALCCVAFRVATIASRPAGLAPYVHLSAGWGPAALCPRAKGRSGAQEPRHWQLGLQHMCATGSLAKANPDVKCCCVRAGGGEHRGVGSNWRERLLHKGPRG